MSFILPSSGPPSAKRLHVLLTNFPAFGHITPMLELAKKISKYHDVTFAVSTFMVSELIKRELLHDSDQVALHGIQDDVVGYIENDALDGGMARVMEQFLPAMGQLYRDIPTRQEPNQSGVMKPVDVLIADMFLGREQVVCHRRGLPYYLFNTGNAFQTYYILCLNDDFPTVPDSEADVFSTLPVRGKPPVPLGIDWKNIFLPMRKAITLATGIIVNSFRDFELDMVANIEEFSEMAKVPVYCIGPLLPEEQATAQSSAQLTTEKNVTEWLDRQQANSVVYVSFGSVASPSPEQMTVIGEALLALDRPFIWALGEKHFSALPEEIPTRIADQFKTPDSKFLVLNWAPQKLILGHAATAVFISHCGWNSTLEGVSHGKPIIAWPLFADQLLNAEFTVKLGAGLLIPDTSVKCLRIVPAEEIQEVIEKVGGWTTGSESSYSKAAKSWREKVNATWTPPSGTSYIEFLNLVKFQAS